jgi:hypothetical protein
MLELNNSFVNGHCGYGGWTQLPDITIFVVDYTKGDGQDMPVQTQPFIRGYFLRESDFRIKKCDTNIDYRCNFSDYAILAQAYLSRTGQHHWNPDVDYYENGFIDLNDVAL